MSKTISRHPGSAVRRWIEAEAAWRADELAQATREAARKRVAADTVHLIRSLVAIAAEADPTARATALAALAPELRGCCPMADAGQRGQSARSRWRRCQARSAPSWRYDRA